MTITFATKLIGYNETPLTINSTGSGTFVATRQQGRDGDQLHADVPRPVVGRSTQAHIHFGRPALTGQIVAVPLLQPRGDRASRRACRCRRRCPPPPATISGTLTAADVIARATQGIDGGAAGFAEMIKAMRAGPRMRTCTRRHFPSGEIRGAIGPTDDDDETTTTDATLPAKHRQIEVVRFRDLDRLRITGVRVAHHAGRRIVPQHARDALARLAACRRRRSRRRRAASSPCRRRRRDAATPTSRRPQC